MLKKLYLHQIGPALDMCIDFSSRLNLLTGDNGLGKSFILDIAWWALTRKWPSEVNKKLTSGFMAKPEMAKIPRILFDYSKPIKATSLSIKRLPIGSTGLITASYDAKLQKWLIKDDKTFLPGLVLYALADGNFALWDPARNYWRKTDHDVSDRLPAYVFTNQDVWDGLRDDTYGLLCNGLIADWAGWQKEKGKPFESLCAVLRALSPSDEEKLSPGELSRISPVDPRDIPTLKMPYRQSVPVLYASAAIKRILALAYLLVWAWQEHLHASRLLEQKPAKQIIFLVDEIEAHLHPKWQRRIIQALLNVTKELASETQVQLIAATHSPLVLASVESSFNQRVDDWFDLDLVTRNGSIPAVELTKRIFIRQGDAANWLMSDAFDLKSARSLEAENVIEEASLVLSNPDISQQSAMEIDQKLRSVLSDIDPFWIRWRFVAEKKGWLE